MVFLKWKNLIWRQWNHLSFVLLKAARRATEVYDYLWKDLQEMMNGSMTPEEAMKDVTEYANSLDYQAPEE